MTLHLTDSNFDQEVLQHDGVVLIDFWAPWCGPCQMMGPVIEELAKELEGKVKVAKLNVDDSPQIAQKYSIMSIPTLMIFKNGEKVDQFMGVQSKEALVERLNSHLTE